MRIDHRRAHVPVAQQLLDCPNIIPIIRQMGREGVAQRMGTCRLGNPNFQSGCLEYTLKDGLVQVVPAPFAGDAVGVMTGGGKTEMGVRVQSGENRSHHFGPYYLNHLNSANLFFASLEQWGTF